MNGAQHCPECGTKMAIKDTGHGGGNTYRIAQCGHCGVRIETLETLHRRLPAHMPGMAPPAVEPDIPPPTVANPPAPAEGVGGSLPEIPSGKSDPNPIASLLSVPRGRARSKRAADREPYEPEFLAEWHLTAKTGSKRSARRAWREAGKPRFGASWKLWETSCPEWQQQWFNYPHVGTWINDGRYEQDPRETKSKPAGQIKAARPDPYCSFHHLPRTRGKLPPHGGAFADCPECKHAAAANGTRSSEPLALGGIR